MRQSCQRQGTNNLVLKEGVALFQAQVTSTRGNGLFARISIEPESVFGQDWPVCVLDGDSETRRLPRLSAPDELMEELVASPRWASLLHGPWSMSFIQRDMDALIITGDEIPACEIPAWARLHSLSADAYAQLGAQLQSNICRLGDSLTEPDDDVLHAMMLLPQLRLVNHSCDPNCELLWDPGMQQGCVCGGACGGGCFLLKARRAICAGEELSFSYLGLQPISTLSCEARRQELLKGWGFWCGCPLCVSQEEHAVCAVRGVDPKRRMRSEGGTLNQQVKQRVSISRAVSRNK
eukprot:CAMPEP_0119323534 /NCGR_PEP_ID=MMETSP1333-20130426/60948_1 /TAXON_ID=418940 /ORGANISM="Scyphosphaera apsteinii, Strain RCC1455" /LENGTH=292 /DNA_ID=CAMNT_0007331007 /DNA_START=41 /DNA_END=919 /DNA_ORIENTATION=+